MWIVFSILTLLLYSVSAVAGKKSLEEGSGNRALKLCCANCIVMVIIALAFWALRLGESGANPLQLLAAHPLLPVAAFCTITIDVFYCFAIKYIPVSLGATINSASGIVPFFAVLIVFLFTKTGIETIDCMQVIGAVLCLAGFFSVMIFRRRSGENGSEAEGGTAPNAARPGEGPAPAAGSFRKKGAADKAYSAFLFGIILALLSMVFDSADSVLLSYILGTKMAGEYDVMMSYLLPAAVTALGLYIYICAKERRAWNVFDLKSERYNQASAWVEQFANFTCVIALGGNPLFANLMIGLYGAGVAVLARLFLKEKLSKPEYVSLVLMLAGIACFTISESM